MGIESEKIKDFSNDPAEALLGSFGKSRNPLLYPKETEFRIFVGCLNDEAKRLEYENLLTRSFRCQNELKNPGDLALLNMEHTFDKEGCFHLVARYAILPEGGQSA